MKLFSSIAASGVVVASFIATAEAGVVDPKIHKLCIEAKDYSGCVSAMKGEEAAPIRMIQIQSADGNQCPSGSAYLGGGNCQQVQCSYTTAGAIRALGHDQLIAGKIDRNGKDVWGCSYKMFLGRGRLRLEGAVLRTTTNPNCPTGEPKLGFNNTCQTADMNWLNPEARAAKKAKEGPKCDFRIKKYNCSYNAYLDANPGMKKWAELNPEMAAKERARLQSVD